MKVDVIIPVYGPGNRLLELFDQLGHQTVPVDRLIVMNTEKSLWDKWTETLEPGRLPENLSVYHVTKEEFDHGATRNAGIEHSDADVCVCMTHDALPADTGLLKALTDALFAEKDIAVAYARQLPAKDCNIIERHTREFNYPHKSRIKRLSDLDTLGIKTYFCSNVCAAYRRRAYLETEGFGKRMIAGEDMLAARRLLEKGWQTVYAPEAEVIYYRNDDLHGLWKRNFDIGVAHAEHPEMIENTKPGKEGVRLVRVTSALLRQNHMEEYLGEVLTRSIVRYLAYQFGRNYERLPEGVVRKCSANKEYWEKK